jgi:hypothetical protein
MNLLEIGLSVVDWIGLAQDRFRWRAFVSSVMNLRVHKMLGNYRVDAQLVASRVVLSSTELVSASLTILKFSTTSQLVQWPALTVRHVHPERQLLSTKSAEEVGIHHTLYLFRRYVSQCGMFLAVHVSM